MAKVIVKNKMSRFLWFSVYNQGTVRAWSRSFPSKRRLRLSLWLHMPGYNHRPAHNLLDAVTSSILSPHYLAKFELISMLECITTRQCYSVQSHCEIG